MEVNQNHSPERQQNVIKGLRTMNQYDSAKIANLMEDNLKTKNG